jgi:hypothetical protein
LTAPLAHCENGTEQPTARTSSPARTKVTGARIANRAQAEAGSSDSSRPSFGAQPGTGPQVRASSPLQARCRTDFQPETAIGQGHAGAGALVPEPGHGRGDSGFRRPGELDLPAWLDGRRGARRDPPDHGRDRFDAFPGNGVGDVVEVDQV